MTAVVLLAVASSAVAQTGTVVGALTSGVTGLPVQGGFVFLCNTATTGACTQTTVNNTGTYAVSVPVGSYVAYTLTSGFVDEISGGVPCPVSCGSVPARLLGTPFVLTTGGKVLNFALRLPGRITGSARDSVSGAPIANLIVQVATRFGDGISITGATTDASGVFTVPEAGPGTWAAYTQNNQGQTHVEEIFGDLLCVGGCSASTAVGSGAPIAVTAGATTPGVDFLLDPGATISGTVRHAVTAAPLQNVAVEARVRVGSNLHPVAFAFTSAAGTYSLPALPAGSYLMTAAHPEFIDEVHNDRPCLAQCQGEEIAAGDRVTVTTGATVANLDFGLHPGGSITGMVREAGTGTPVSAGVSAMRVVGPNLVAAASTTTTNGAYKLLGLAPGTYFVIASSAPHVPEIFGGVHCVPCQLSVVVGGTPVPVTGGPSTTNIDFTLDRAATIAGTVRSAPSNTAVVDAPVAVFRAGSPNRVTTAVTDTAGNYTAGGLPPGTYFVASVANRFANQVYNGLPCPAGTCSAAFATNGTPIPVAAGGTASGISFLLGPATGPPGFASPPVAVNTPGGVLFTWTAPQTGGVATSYLFEAGFTSGTTFATLPVATNSLFVPGVPPGVFFIRVRGVNAAGAGPASSELTLRVGAGGIVAPNVPGEVSLIVSAGKLTATWSPPGNGPVPTSYLLEVGSAAGLSNIAVVPVAGQAFLFSGVPPGYYFVRVRAVVGGVAGPPTRDTVMIAGDVAAPPSEPRGFSSTVAGNVVTLSWRGPTFGPVTSYVLEAGTATGLANITTFSTGNANTSLVVPGVPPGTYFLRLRAVNAQGSSPPSFEHVLVVP